ncbi:MAG: GSU2403 family nucleotidyltransferase fold protein [Candidatus Methylomirabilia bacterium]
MQRLPLETQTIYAELLDRLTALDARRSIGQAPGSFVAKTVKGQHYWYFQHSEPGGIQRQVYVGAKHAALDRVVARYREDRAALRDDTASVERLCAILRAGGALITDTPSARVLKALADAGVFHLGGVLVGTHAFVVLGNLLGASWSGAALRTLDIDLAARATMDIALPHLEGDLPGVLDQLEMGFLPVPPLDPRQPSTSFKVRGAGLRVDLLTTVSGRRKTGPVPIPRLHAAAQPLPFLDFIMEHPVRGAVVNGGGVLVNVPNPARFALHKLIVAGERDAFMHSKREKDLRQAAQLLSLLVDERPGDIRIAWEEIQRRGRGWQRRVADGLNALGNTDRDTAAAMKTLLKPPMRGR